MDKDLRSSLRLGDVAPLKRLTALDHTKIRSGKFPWLKLQTIDLICVNGAASDLLDHAVKLYQIALHDRWRVSLCIDDYLVDENEVS